MLVATIALTDAAALGPWRAQATVEACLAEDLLWTRIPDAAAAARLGWTSWPALDRYQLVNGALVPLGTADRKTPTLPVRQIPAGPWTSLAELWPVVAPNFGFGGTASGIARSAVALVPSTAEQPCTHLMVALEVVAAWAEMAPVVRLGRLIFAASDDGLVLLTGDPLPPLPGQPWWTPHPGVLIPAGWALAPWLRPEWIAAASRLPKGGLVLCHPEGRCLSVPEEGFLPLTRASLRATRTNLARSDSFLS